MSTPTVTRLLTYFVSARRGKPWPIISTTVEVMTTSPAVPASSSTLIDSLIFPLTSVLVFLFSLTLSGSVNFFEFDVVAESIVMEMHLESQVAFSSVRGAVTTLYGVGGNRGLSLRVEYVRRDRRRR